VIIMLVAIAVIGGLALVAIAVLVGVLEARSTSAAWERIAVARRVLQERDRRLDAREADLDALQAHLDRRQRGLDGRE